MEAPERHQIDQPALASGGSVRALGDRLVIESLTVSDERAARLVRERAEAGQPAAETVTDAIEVGARVLEREGTAANVDYVKRELQEGLGGLNRELAATLEAGSQELAERIASSFGADRSDSVQQQIRELVATHLDRRVGELTRLLGSEDPSNPLVSIQVRTTKAMLEAEERHRKQVSDLREELSGLRENVGRVFEKQEADERIAEAEEAGTRKGRSFEERVHLAIEQIADGRGDVAHHTGELRGDGGGKKGDTVVEIGAADDRCRARVVFEVKDKKLSKNEAWKELDAALEGRDAQFSVLVVAGEERVPAGREPLHEYEGNKLIVPLDRDEPGGIALEFAYRYARSRALMAREAEIEIDAASVLDAAEKARSRLKELQRARLALTRISDGAESVRETIDSIDAAVRSELERIEALADG